MKQPEKITVHWMMDSSEYKTRTWTMEKQLNRLPHLVEFLLEALETMFF